MANETTAHQISSDTSTEGIRIQVFPDYMPEHSSPEQNRFTFSYKVIITNESEAKVKLLSRHWVIINSDGDPEKVDGPGVVGYTPDLEPGESFEYGSQTPLKHRLGNNGRFLHNDARERAEVRSKDRTLLPCKR